MVLTTTSKCYVSHLTTPPRLVQQLQAHIESILQRAKTVRLVSRPSSVGIVPVSWLVSGICDTADHGVSDNIRIHELGNHHQY